MSLWLLSLVVLLVGFAVIAVVFVIPFAVDLNRHRKDRLARSQQSETSD